MIMRSAMYTVFIFLVAGVAQAATVTLDFEDNYTNVGNDTFTQGFKLNGSGGGLDAFEYATVRTSVISGNSSYDVGASGGTCNSGGCNFAGFNLMRADGGVFALYAFDVDFSAPEYSFRGDTADGGSVNLSTPLGTGDWLNLTRVSWDVATPAYFPFADDIGVSVDNIVVSAVPVPAAVWLFAYGLAALGWLRRRS
jgi:hypothetical protein